MLSREGEYMLDAGHLTYICYHTENRACMQSRSEDTPLIDTNH